MIYRFSGLSRICGVHSFRLICTTSQNLSKGFREKIAKKQQVGIPPQIQNGITSWLKALELEIDAANQAVKELLSVSNNNWNEVEIRGLALANLRLQSDVLDPVNGRLISFRKIGSGTRRGFSRGAPIVVCEASNMRVIADGIFLDSRDGMTVKIYGGSKFDNNTHYVILPSQTSGTLHTLKEILQNKKAIVKSPGISLLHLAFRARAMPSIHNDRLPSGISKKLDWSQVRAVSAALNKKREFVCIQGPPGTGKTAVTAEIIRLLMQKNQKVLCCGPTHVAVDNLAQRTRLAVMENGGAEYLGDLNESSVSTPTLETAMEEHPDYEDLQAIAIDYNEAQDDNKAKLKRHMMSLKFKILKDSYKGRRAIFTTVSSSVVQKLSIVKWFPDVVIIDEAAQCFEPATWAVILRAKRVILIGDHQQLPAIVASEEAAKANLGVSLMERLAKEFKDNNLLFMLNTQYRSNALISQWSSTQFYNDLLIAHDSVKDRCLSDICSISPESPLNSPLLMFNTDIIKGSRNEKNAFAEQSQFLSFTNQGEAELVMAYVEFLIANGVPANSIGVITPYYEQLKLIRQFCDHEEVAVNTVDAFQGQEKDVIVFSMVRHNPDRKIGFLSEQRRMNVAVTRARRQFMLIGSGRMMSRNKFLNSLFLHIRNNGKIIQPQLILNTSLEDHRKKFADF